VKTISPNLFPVPKHRIRQVEGDF